MRTTENRRARMRCGRNTFRVYYPFDYRFEALFVLVLAPSLSPSQLWLCLSLWTSSSVGRSSSSFAHFECQTRRKFTQVIYICSLSVIFTRMKKKRDSKYIHIYVSLFRRTSFVFMPLLLLMMRQCQIYFIPFFSLLLLRSNFSFVACCFFFFFVRSCFSACVLTFSSVRQESSVSANLFAVVDVVGRFFSMRKLYETKEKAMLNGGKGV